MANAARAWRDLEDEVERAIRRLLRLARVQYQEAIQLMIRKDRWHIAAQRAAMPEALHADIEAADRMLATISESLTSLEHRIARLEEAGAAFAIGSSRALELGRRALVTGDVNS